jgi:hypothetical protein
LILVAAERAKDFPQKPVRLLGTDESVETPMVSQMQDFTSSRAFHVAGPTAFVEAGITHKDVDHMMIYDAPCSLPGASFAHLPLNTNGGRLSYMHSGMYGMYALQESVRQMRGTAPAQIPGARISVCHGVGGMFAASGTIIMSNELPRDSNSVSSGLAAGLAISRRIGRGFRIARIASTAVACGCVNPG